MFSARNLIFAKHLWRNLKIEVSEQREDEKECYVFRLTILFNKSRFDDEDILNAKIIMNNDFSNVKKTAYLANQEQCF